jgi:gamma-glutamyltranspeptidase/glutathione hydrolase
MPVLAANVLATSQPLAAQAGLRMLLKGGNAADAAVATAIALTILEPTGNGVGSDAFALVWDGAALHGLNASGRSPMAWSPERFDSQARMPALGWDAVTVPGAVSAWVALSERFGALPFSDLFEPAVRYAREGFPVAPKTAFHWALAEETYRGFREFAEAFLPEGRAPGPGKWFRLPALADTLEAVAETRGESFYRGELAQRIAAHARASGGALSIEDLAGHRPEWIEALGQEYHGVCLHELPPNTQGIAALLALGILRHTDLPRYPADSAESVHLQLEAMKLAFSQAHRCVADPAAMDVDPRRLLDEGFLADRAREIRMDRAGHPAPRIPGDGGTVCLAAGDERGMMISLLQSNYGGFGSGVVVPGTGIALQNRGFGFTLEPGHPNRVAGGKRPFHTLVPAFASKNGAPFMSFAFMGGGMQPQGHVQMIVRIVDCGQNPQAAADAPRWRIREDGRIAVERGFEPAVLEGLKKRGHDLVVDPEEASFGGAQLVGCLGKGYWAASDPRKDGQAVGF